MTGYSKRTLVEKLGIKPNFVITLIDHPVGYEKILGPLPKNVKIALIEEGLFDFIQCFVKDYEELKHIFPILKRHLKQNKRKKQNKSRKATNKKKLKKVF